MHQQPVGCAAHLFKHPTSCTTTCQGSNLFYFRSAGASAPLGVVPLEGAVVASEQLLVPPASGSAPRALHTLQLALPADTQARRKAYLLAASSEQLQVRGAKTRTRVDALAMTHAALCRAALPRAARSLILGHRFDPAPNPGPVVPCTARGVSAAQHADRHAAAGAGRAGQPRRCQRSRPNYWAGQWQQ